MYTDFGIGDDNVIVYFIADIWITMNFNLLSISHLQIERKVLRNFSITILLLDR